MNVLAIDPSNRTGFAHSDGYRGVELLTRAADTHPGQRLIRFEEWLHEMLTNHPADLVAAEDASFGSHNPSIQAQHNELRGIIHLVAAEFGVKVKLFNPMTIKVHATGNGHAKKPAMVKACQFHIDPSVVDEDVADALWILDLANRPDCWPQPKEKKRARRGVKVLPPTKRYKRLF